MIEADDLLQNCSSAVFNGFLSRSCWDKFHTDPRLNCPLVKPERCLKSPMIPLILATLLPDRRNWRETLLVLPLRQTDSHLFFNEIQEVYTTGHLTGNLSIPLYFQGIYLHAFDQIINQLLNRDTFWLCMSLTSLLILLGLWTQSLVVPFVTLMSISWSLLIAYTIYGKLLQIPHFPIINLLTIVLAIGLGADDLLIFRQTWIQNRIRYEHLPPDQVELDDIEVIGNDNRSSDSLSLSPCPVSNLGTNTVENDVSQDLVKNPSSHLNRTLEQLKIDQIYCTLLHAVPPMTLTTMSTLSGLFMNFCSSILAIQRFAIYSCLVIMCNYVFIICIIPSWFLISQSDLGLFWKRFANIRRRCHDLGENINPFKMFAKIVIYLRILCPILYAILVFFSIHQLIWLRKFDLPNHTNNSSNTVNLISSIGGSSTFLNSHHPFELFVHKHSQLFWVERNLHYYQNLIQINFVWGPLPKDERSLFNYNHDDPVKVLLTFDPDLNLISNLARQWLGKFCNELKQMPYLFKPISFGYNQYMMDSFKLSNLNPILSQPIWCPLGRFVNSLDNYVIAQPCYQNQSTSVCCLNGKHLDIYNDSSELFLPCLYEYFSLDSSESYTGYRFYQTRKELSNPVGFVTTVLTNISMILNTHVQITSYLDELNIWFNNQLSTAPKSLSKGFMFAPGLNHYEITTNVTNNVYWSSLVAIIIATFLILLCSLNIILACLAFFALSGCLLFSINLLTFIDGWSLGVIEGLVINLAAGLAIDPCIHLAWYLSKTMHKFNLNRDSQGTLSYTSSFIQTSLVHFGPAITGSAWTTALAGVPMLFSNLVCYHQIGAFLVCLMLSSWLFCFVLFAGTLACCDCIFFKRMFK